MIAPSIAAAFLGCLAFASWLLWLRRTDERKALTAEMRNATAEARRLFDESASAVRKVDERLRKLEMKTGFGP